MQVVCMDGRIKVEDKRFSIVRAFVGIAAWSSAFVLMWLVIFGVLPYITLFWLAVFLVFGLGTMDTYA
jgi:hypothetical protein